MSEVVMNKKDEIIMKLVHYFITEENYNPIVVNGVKDEVWLENNKGPYNIIRINSKNIFNIEQLNYDYFKIESIVRQIKKKTLLYKPNTLNILLDVNEDLKIEDHKSIIDVPIFNNDLNIKDSNILEAFPNINDKLLKDAVGLDLIINVTKDINKKTEKENKTYEDTFKPKRLIVTPLLMLLCIIGFVLELYVCGVDGLLGVTNMTVYKLGANYGLLVKAGEIWRLGTYMFLHGSILHLFVNMYSLYMIGSQIETYLGKTKYIIIYLISGICGGLLSAVATESLSVGASGAIFGLLGAMVCFGYHYRLYLGNVLKTQIIPIILLNLFLGFSLTGIDNFGHIGGLVGGLFVTMALGIKNKSKTSERVNGIICLLVFIGVLSYMIFR